MIGTHDAGAELRCIDWRFLLPAPAGRAFAHLVVLGGGLAVEGWLRETGVALRVSHLLDPEEPTDVLAILDDARWPDHEAVRALTADAVLYWETGRHPGTIRRMLARLGFDRTAIYRVRPRRGGARLYLPVDPAAAHWYFGEVNTPWTLRRRAEYLLQLRAPRLARLLPAGRYAVVARRGGDLVPGPVRLAASSARRALDLPVIMIADQDGRPANRVVLFPFGSGGRPRAVVKVPRLPALAERTAHEQRVLDAVRSALPEAMRSSLPEPLGCFEFGQITAGVESYLEGRSIQWTSGASGARLARQLDDLARASAWLTEFHLAGSAERAQWNAEQSARWIDQPIVAYQTLFGLSPAERRLCDRLSELSRAAAGAVLPIVWQHHDFNVWNLLRDGGQVRVLDWEGARRGLPLCDLVQFVTHWHDVAAHLRSPERRFQGFEQLFLARSGAGRRIGAARDALHRYRERLELDPRLVPVLVARTWFELAVRHATQQLDWGSSGARRAGNPYIGYIGTLAQHADELHALAER